MSRVGERAPSFRLPSLAGPEVALEDFRGKKRVVVWFTKGLACVFCRRHMIQMRRDYPRIRALDAEFLEVTPTRPERARFYAAHFQVPFPYLLDPGQKTWAEWGLGRRSHGPAYYVRALLAGSKMEKPPASEVGPMKPSLGEIPGLLADEDTALYVLDRQGIVRRVLAEGQYVTAEGDRPRVLGLPSTDEILAAIEACDR